MEYWQITAIAVLGALAVYFAGRLALIRHDLREMGTEFTRRVHENTNTLISVGSWDSAVRQLADEMNEALVVYREKRHIFEGSDRQMREDIANLAHDLRTPLTAVVGYLDLMQDHPERCRDYVPILRGRTDLMTQVISELFEYSMSQSGRPLHMEPADLCTITENCAVSLWTLFTEAGVEPVISMPEEPVPCLVDVSAAQRLITNVLSNAVRHGEGSVHICVSGSGSLRVSNRAPRMDVLEVERLFDRYFTVQPPGQRTTGLGLGIARSLAVEMGGSMDASLAHGLLTVTVQFRTPGSAA